MPVTTRFLVMLIVTALALGGSHPGASARAADPALQAKLETLWDDLADDDEGKATRAVLTLTKTPKEAVAFLKDRLPPLKVDAKRVARLIGDLDSDQFPTRKRAVEDLEYLGKYVRDDLKKALEMAKDGEVKKRLRDVLDSIPKPVDEVKAPIIDATKGISVSSVNGKVWINGVALEDLAKTYVVSPRTPRPWARAARAVAALEHLDTPEARGILESLAGGEKDALPTEQAKAALDRLKKTP